MCSIHVQVRGHVQHRVFVQYLCTNCALVVLVHVHVGTIKYCSIFALSVLGPEGQNIAASTKSRPEHHCLSCAQKGRLDILLIQLTTFWGKVAHRVFI